MSTIGAPVAIKVVQPRDDDGTVLDNTNATATVNVHSLDGTEIVATIAMIWDATFGRWEYQWDTTGMTAGTYRAEVLVAPTAGIATPRWIDIVLDTGPGTSAVLSASPYDPWPADLCCDITGVDAVVVDRMVAAATEVYWGLSGRQFGVVTVPAIRPCRKDCYSGGYGWNQWLGGNPFASGWAPAGWQSGWWFPLVCGGGCIGDCSCTELQEIRLPSPVAQVVEVKVDGVVLAASAYRVDNWDTLVRIDGGVWPACQAMGLADTADGTMSVTVKVGKQVPVIGSMAVAELACELISGCAPGSECAVPGHLVARTRAGNTEAFASIAELVANNLTGFPIGELFLRTFNPSKLMSRSSVHSPDYQPARRAGT